MWALELMYYISIWTSSSAYRTSWHYWKKVFLHRFSFCFSNKSVNEIRCLFFFTSKRSSLKLSLKIVYPTPQEHEVLKLFLKKKTLTILEKQSKKDFKMGNGKKDLETLMSLAWLVYLVKLSKIYFKIFISHETITIRRLI